MKKRIVSLFLVVLMLASACAGNSSTPTTTGNAPSNDNKVYKFTINNQVAEGNYISILQNYIADQLEERSGGRIEGTVYDAGSFGGPDKERLEMAISGAISMSTVPASLIAAMGDNLNAWNVYDVPYMFDTQDDLYSFFEGEIGQELVKLASDSLGVDIPGLFSMGFCAVSSNKPIHVPPDIKGVKIRSGQITLTVESLKMWDAVPSTVDYSESYTAMQQGTVDGTATALTLWETAKWYEVQKNIVLNRYSNMPHFFVVSKVWYNSLPADLQAIFDEVIKDGYANARKVAQKAEDDSIAFLSEHMDVYVPSEDEMVLWKVPARDMWTNTAADVVGGKDFLNRCLKWRGIDPI